MHASTTSSASSNATRLSCRCLVLRFLNPLGWLPTFASVPKLREPQSGEASLACGDCRRRARLTRRPGFRLVTSSSSWTDAEMCVPVLSPGAGPRCLRLCGPQERRGRAPANRALWGERERGSAVRSCDRLVAGERFGGTSHCQAERPPLSRDAGGVQCACVCWRVRRTGCPIVHACVSTHARRAAGISRPPRYPFRLGAGMSDRFVGQSRLEQRSMRT